MNDTHPTVAVAELMRILVDEEGLSWDEAWEITTHSVAYTNHTIMAEALEKWPIDIFQRLLPRVYQIVEEINRRFVLEIQNRYPGNDEKIRKMAILYDGQVKMANMAICAGIAFTAWKFDNEAGQYTEMSLASTSAKTNEYWIGSATSASLRGRMIFLQPQESVRIQMTSTTYPDLVLTTNAFAVGEENATGIDKVVNEAGSELQIIPGRGELTLRANGQTRAAVFTIDGKQVWNGSVQNGEKTIRLNRGIYVVNGKKVVL